MDRDANDTFDLLDEIEKELGIATCPVNWPIGSGKNFKGVFDREKNKVFTYSDTERVRRKVSQPRLTQPIRTSLFQSSDRRQRTNSWKKSSFWTAPVRNLI